jgi:FkbM family methyltransferase
MHPLLYAIKRRYRKEKLPDPFAYLFKWFGCVPRGVFQVGASGGQEAKAFATQGIKHGIFVEPLPDAFAKLELAIHPHSGYFAVNALCDSVAGKSCNFFVSSGVGASSSMLKPTGHLVSHPEVGFGDKPLVLTSTTVDKIAAEFRENGRADVIDSLDLLYLDTQGAELNVLKGSEEFLKQVRFIFTEVSHGGLYEGDVSLNTLMEFLAQRGFVLVFTYLNKHGWGDALFIRNSLLDRDKYAG